MGLIHCNLRVLMAERGLNIQKVKDKTTLSRTTISNLYNNNGAGIQFDTLKELCELLKCRPGDLLSYIDIEPVFEIMNKAPDLSKKEDTQSDEEGKKYIYISNIEADLNIRSKVRYEGNIHDFDFQAKVEYGINHHKEIVNLNVGTSPHLEYQLHELNLPPRAEEYVYEFFYEYLLEWAHNLFYGEEVEEVGSVFIDHYDLLR